MKIDLGKNIAPRDIETRIQKFWDENDFWANDVNSKQTPFCVMMPPPNVTGNLHMGHALDNVMTDIICRYKRMCGFDVEPTMRLLQHNFWWNAIYQSAE